MQTILDQFGFLRISGRDALKFLQGYTTCDLDDLDDRTSLKGAICNIQGRMLTSFRVIRAEDGALMLRMHRDLLETTRDFLSKYIVFSKATMTIETNRHCVATWSDDVIEADHYLREGDDDVISCGHGRFERWTNTAATTDPAILQQWNDAEITDGIAWVTPATSETFLPQMFDYHNQNAISFSKGCYLGQEIVARTQYKGALKRRLFRGKELDLVPGKNPPPTPGESLTTSEGRSIGTVVASSPTQMLAVLSATEPTTVVVGDAEVIMRPVADQQ